MVVSGAVRIECAAGQQTRALTTISQISEQPVSTCHDQPREDSCLNEVSQSAPLAKSPYGASISTRWSRSIAMSSGSKSLNDPDHGRIAFLLIAEGFCAIRRCWLCFLTTSKAQAGRGLVTSPQPTFERSGCRAAHERQLCGNAPEHPGTTLWADPGRPRQGGVVGSRPDSRFSRILERTFSQFSSPFVFGPIFFSAGPTRAAPPPFLDGSRPAVLRKGSTCVFHSLSLTRSGPPPKIDGLADARA